MKSYYIVRLVDGMVMQFDASKTTVDYEDNPNAVAIREGGLAMKHQKIVAVIPIKQLVYIKLVEEESGEEAENSERELTDCQKLLLRFGEMMIENNWMWEGGGTTDGIKTINIFYKETLDDDSITEINDIVRNSGIADKIEWISQKERRTK